MSNRNEQGTAESWGKQDSVQPSPSGARCFIREGSISQMQYRSQEEVLWGNSLDVAVRETGDIYIYESSFRIIIKMEAFWEVKGGGIMWRGKRVSP